MFFWLLIKKIKKIKKLSDQRLKETHFWDFLQLKTTAFFSTDLDKNLKEMLLTSGYFLL